MNKYFIRYCLKCDHDWSKINKYIIVRYLYEYIYIYIYIFTTKVLLIKYEFQEYLMFNRPDYVCRAEKRQNILTEIANLRDKRKPIKRELLMTNYTNNRVPPNPLGNTTL